jgi:putative membrane-bound dehydrogenase-like protein
MRLILASLLISIAVGTVTAAPPKILDDGLVIELAAEQPDIVTPTGLAVDEQGRVWVIENHTHQRPPKYKGPETDRIRIFSEPDTAGRFRKIETFAEGFKDSMSLALRKDGAVYLATRKDIWLLRDPKNEGKATQSKVIVKLDSPGDYPHNGLSGFAFDGLGDMYFSLGENLGAPYKLIGSDGVTLSGGGEGGSIYRCKPDGSKLERVATGFWNTFHLAFDPFGRLFAVDNDPDARGPCRLLHIIQGGDYGYRFRNGRRGLHPFTAWNGELPGTLPMVAGTAEAPSGIAAYDSIGLPKDYLGKLLVTSWGDHVIENFALSPRGASFSAKSTVLVRGGENFRPVGIVTAPDGSLYVSDWVDKSYPVHGKGAIWRIRMKDPPKDDGLRPSKLAKLPVEQLSKLLGDDRGDIRAAAAEALQGKGREGGSALIAALKDFKIRTRINALWGVARLETALARKQLTSALDDAASPVRAEASRLVGPFLPFDEFASDVKLALMATNDPFAFVRMHAVLQLHDNRSLKAIAPLLADADPFLAAAALDVLGRPGKSDLLLPLVESKDARQRLGILLAIRRAQGLNARNRMSQFLNDPDPAVRRAAIQWVAEDRLTEHKEAIVKAAAKEPITRDLFEALLAAQQMLDAVPKKPLPENSGEEHVARIVKDPKQPAVFRSFGLRMLRPDHPALTVDLLKDMLYGDDAASRHEALRTLAMRADDASQQLLRGIAADGWPDHEFAIRGDRAFAIVGLTQSAANSEPTRKLLLSLLANEGFRRDALRSLRGVALNADERKALFAWWDGLPAENGDPSLERIELAEQLSLVLGPDKEKDKDRRKRLADLIGEMPSDEASWHKALSARGNAESGERVFYHLRSARCAVCHRIDGRGGLVGPELSVIGKSLDRDKLIDSILTPSKEIAPAFTTWNITMFDGKKHTGIILGENFDSTLTLADADGKRITLKRLDIDDRQASTKSLMPDDLHRLMTRQDFRDLLEFLSPSRGPK